MLKLLDGVFVRADSRQYILLIEQDVNKKDGTTAKELIECGYYSTMESLVKCAVEKVLRDKVSSNKLKTLQDWLKEYATLSTKLQLAELPKIKGAK